MTSNNSMTCNPNTGICEISLEVNLENFEYVAPKIKDKVIVEYFTDPTCAACWGLEPVLAEFEHKYGDFIDLRYIMGGMLDKSSLSQEEAMAAADHWEEFGEMFNMPITGKVMRNKPLTSSYPPSLAYLAAKNQDLDKANKLLRKMREALLVFGKNVDKEEVLEKLAQEVGLDVNQFMIDFYNPETMDKLEYDIAYTRVNGVGGFPTVIMYGPNKPSMIIRGVRQIHEYSDALSNFIELKAKKTNYQLKEVFERFDLLSTREVSELMDVYFVEDMAKDLEVLEKEGFLEKIEVNGGCYWRKK